MYQRPGSGTPICVSYLYSLTLINQHGRELLSRERGRMLNMGSSSGFRILYEDTPGGMRLDFDNSTSRCAGFTLY